MDGVVFLIRFTEQKCDNSLQEVEEVMQSPPHKVLKNFKSHYRFLNDNTNDANLVSLRKLFQRGFFVFSLYDS